MEKRIKKIVGIVICICVMFCMNGLSVDASELNMENKYTEVNGNDVLLGNTYEINGIFVKYEEFTVEHPDLIKSPIQVSGSAIKNSTYTHTSRYYLGDSNTGEIWYKIDQITNYTYDGVNSVYIDKNKTYTNVTQYKSNGHYDIMENKFVNNGNVSTYTFTVLMKIGSKWHKASDTVYVYPNGSTSFKHSMNEV